MTSKNIVVVGSCMIDFVSYAPRLPQPGETIHGTKFMTNFGGKGANQCVAAAKLGGRTILVARVGDDLWGDQYIANLKTEKVETKYIQKTADATSGIAQITVSDTGDNQIVVVAGANEYLNVEDLDEARHDISGAGVVVLQLETSPEVAIKALQLCRGISILNAAPALDEYDRRLLTLPTIFCVNEIEASVFTGLPVTTLAEAKLAAQDLIKKGCNSVVLTLGDKGALYLEKSSPESVYHTSPSVNCIDSTGAGDAFVGAFAFFLANYKNLSIEKMIESACYIAADSVTRPGTQKSFSGREILEKCLKAVFLTR
jgi:ribokinase